MRKEIPDQLFNRRKFINTIGIGTAAMAVSPQFAFAKHLNTDRKIRIGIIGGRFGAGFFFMSIRNVL